MRHPVKKIRAFARGVLWLALGLACISPALAQGDVAGLARDVEHAEGIRAAKNLQYAYAQYGQAGLWSEIGKLFAAKGEAVFGRDGVKGPAAIARYLRGRYGDGKDGVSKGGLHVQFQLAPIVNLSADGKTAQGRWHELALLGAGPGDAHWAGGILEITYVKENGVWKIARLEYHPMFAGSYADGWRNVEADLKIVPYHYTAQSAGIPVPPLVDAPLPGKAREADVLARIAALNDEDKVRNLQNAYGYYVDRKMWSDITDLFTADGVLEIAGQGIYENPAGIARALEIAGPQGLAHGEINDHLQLDEQVQIKGNEARIRGLEFGMLGMNHARGYLSVTVFENRFVKQDGVWRIREMRLFPNMKTDYAQGWGLSRIVDGPAPSPHAPDRSAPEIDTPDSSPRFFLPNPVTGKAVAFAVGTKVSAKAICLLPFRRWPNRILRLRTPRRICGNRWAMTRWKICPAPSATGSMISSGPCWAICSRPMAHASCPASAPISGRRASPRQSWRRMGRRARRGPTFPCICAPSR